MKSVYLNLMLTNSSFGLEMKRSSAVVMLQSYDHLRHMVYWYNCVSLIETEKTWYYESNQCALDAYFTIVLSLKYHDIVLQANNMTAVNFNIANKRMFQNFPCSCPMLSFIQI